MPKKGLYRGVMILSLMPVWVGGVPSRDAKAAYPDLRGRNREAQDALRPRLAAISRDHPRIFFHDAELNDVRERISSVPEIAETYGWLKEWVAQGEFYRNLWATPSQLIAAAIAYRLEPHAETLEFAASIADYLAESQGDSWTYPRIAKGLAFAYDWLYDALTPERRERYAYAAVRNAMSCYDTWRHSDFNNHLYLEYGPVLYVGIALYGDGVEEEAVERFALDGLDLLVNHLMPAHELVNGGDSGWHESLSYHAFFTYEFAHLIELWQSATGDDLWSTFTGLDGEGAFQLYATMPDGKSWVGVADIGERDAFSEANASFLVLLERRRKDGLAGYWAERIRKEAKRRFLAGGRYVRVGSSWWAYLLWHDPTVPTVTPNDLPTARLFRGIGWMSARSDWSPDATFALFVCAPLWLGGHQHADNNSFIVYRNGMLAVDSGVYEASAHRANYSARTIAHNTVTVYDPNESFPGGVWGVGEMGKGVNDGGQSLGSGPDFVTDVQPDDAYHRARILGYQHTDDYTYVLGDATKSYSPTKVREFTRAFLFIHPNLFVVFDRVEANDPRFTKTWLLHTPVEPTQSGKVFRVAHGSETLQLLPVLPRAATATVIGGTGREFEVAGRNYPPTEGDYDRHDAGRARIEIRPLEPARRDYFLNVLVTDGSEALSDVAVAPIETDAAVGVEIRHANRLVIATFTKTGDLIGTLELRDTSGNVVQPRSSLEQVVQVP
jgi:hypothetical protein